ncbi:MAG: HAD-IC family P-type ATPase, partial [Gemmatimonadota bacterium]
THGRAEVAGVERIGGGDSGEALSIAAALEARSEHPLGKAIVRAGRNRGLEFESRQVGGFEAIPGWGVQATVDGVSYAVKRLVGSELPDQARLESLRREGQTVVLLARKEADGTSRPIALLALDDGPRAGLAELTRDLRASGIDRIVVLSGDHEAAVQVVGRAIGADEVRAGLQPAEKVDAVRELEASHGALAMVGDGVNDAPALAAASVGIALGAAASDAALETADVALMGDDLGRLPYLVRLARKSRKVIRQNIIAAIVIKTILALGVPLGFVSLIVAVLVGDMGASLAVTANALRLARVSPVESS